MSTIVVPLDGSERSEQALPYAALFGKLLNANVCLLHVVTEGEVHDFVLHREQLRELYLPYRQPERDTQAAIRRHEETYLAGKLPALHEAGLSVRTEVAFGTPAAAIVDVAGQCEAALIVMSTHGRGGVGRMLLGSVAYKVIRLSACPLLAVRRPVAQPALRRILVPLDGSARARQALPLAADLARRAGATLVLLTVIAPLFGLDPAVALPPREDQLRTLRARMRLELQRVAGAYPDLASEIVVGEGFVGETICHEAEQQRADLIVMAALGHTGSRQFSLGSVTDKVLHAAPAPVLVVPLPEVSAEGLN